MGWLVFSITTIFQLLRVQFSYSMLIDGGGDDGGGDGLRLRLLAGFQLLDLMQTVTLLLQ